jgi:hypothetical protein
VVQRIGASDVRGADKLGAAAERPEPWRALYRRVGDVFMIAAIAPEARQVPRSAASRLPRFG